MSMFKFFESISKTAIISPDYAIHTKGGAEMFTLICYNSTPNFILIT